MLRDESSVWYWWWGKSIKLVLFTRFWLIWIFILCSRYAFQIVLQTRELLRTLPSLVDINVPDGKNFTVCGDVHGQVIKIFWLFHFPLHLFHVFHYDSTGTLLMACCHLPWLILTTRGSSLTGFGSYGSNSYTSILIYLPTFLKILSVFCFRSKLKCL